MLKRQGNELDDIVTPEDNDILIRECMRLACSLTSMPDQSVFFMIAGGRKTMSACLALSAQFYGRPNDRIYHVLVDPPEFENSRDFYYPPRESTLIRLRDRNGQELFKESRYANVHLVSMPFASVRSMLSDSELDAPADPEALLMSLIKDRPARLTVDLKNSKLIFKEMELDLSPVRMAIYAFFAQLRKECTCSARPGECTKCFMEITEVLDNSQAIERLYEEIATSNSPCISPPTIKELDAPNFMSYCSKLNAAIRSRFCGDAVDLIISSFGTRPYTRYGIRFDPQRISIVRGYR
jgi:CRISPR-associated protein Csx14